MIDLKTIFLIALRAIKANKMRSILTSLGIIIGVAAVIVMLSVGNGAQISIQNEMKTMGSNLIIVRSGVATSSGARGGHGSQPTMKKSDGDAIQDKISAIRLAAPVLDETAQIVYGNANWSTGITGTDSRMFEIKEWKLSYGRMFSETDVKNASKVAILGQTVVNELFGDVDPLGKTIRIKGVPFQVIGVLVSRGQSGMGMDQDDAVYIPITTAQKKLMGIKFPDQVKMIMLQAVDSRSTYTAQDEIKQLLRQRHNLGANKDDDFVIMNLTQMMEMMESSTKVMTILLGAIASISLLVGGIGIMNIMLVSVTERTREIGIRMAIGAKAWDIRWQFLAEALVLSLIGGLVGVLCGLIGSYLVGIFSSLPAKVSFIYVLLPFSFAGFVGLFFGFYPAYKASLLNPINALRYE
ncbi:MAG: ABC transporter permease [bacterium]|nr:ABC transporter permease [bacterium]MDY2831086.1 ABC transporter permease [Alphaproteobacteria bacterium]